MSSIRDITLLKDINKVLGDVSSKLNPKQAKWRRHTTHETAVSSKTARGSDWRWTAVNAPRILNVISRK